MPSPFPGMNPYIEQPSMWKDFHDSFIPMARDVLSAQVRPQYYVKIEEHLFIREPDSNERYPVGQPDVSIHQFSNTGLLGNGGVAVAAPAYVGLLSIVNEERVPYLEIIDASNRKVVTVLELLSPSNKSVKRDRRHYLAKVQALLEGSVNFVEIDLLRSGRRMPWTEMPPCDYCVVVSTPDGRRLDPPRAGLWSMRLRDPLPTIPIPLHPGVTEPSLDLQALLHRIYDAAGYDLFIYENEPDPQLKPADAEWAANIVNTRNKNVTP